MKSKFWVILLEENTDKKIKNFKVNLILSEKLASNLKNVENL